MPKHYPTLNVSLFLRATSQHWLWLARSYQRPKASPVKRLKLIEEVGRKEDIASDCFLLVKILEQQGRGSEGHCYAVRAVAIFTELSSPRLAEAQAALADFLA